MKMSFSQLFDFVGDMNTLVRSVGRHNVNKKTDIYE